MAFDLVARLKLQDDFSDKIKRIGKNLGKVKEQTNKAAKASGDMGRKFSTASTVAVTGVNKVSSSADKMSGRMQSAGNKAKSSLGNISSSANNAKNAIVGIGSAVGAIALVNKGFNMLKSSIDGAVARYDTLNAFPKVMEKIGFSTEKSSKSIKRLVEGIDGLPTTLGEVADTTQRIAVMTKDLDGATETTLALNNAFLASGADAEKASRGTEQYIKMIATGKVGMDSWTSLQETMGLALNDLAEAFGYAGKSAQNDLYKALKDGDITFDQFNKKLVELSKKTGGFAEMALDGSGGIATAWKNIKTAVTNGVAGSITAIDKALGGTGEIEDLIKQIKPVIGETFKSANKYLGSFAKSMKKAYNATKPIQPLLKNIEKAVLIFGGVLSGLAVGAGVLISLSALFTLLATPMSLIIVGIGALATGFIIAYKKIEPFRKAVNKIKDGIEGFYSLVQGNEGKGASLLMSMGISKEVYFEIKKFADVIREAGEKLKDAQGLISGFFDTFQNGDTAEGFKKMLESGLDLKQIKKVYEFANEARTAFGNLKGIYDVAVENLEMMGGKIANAMTLVQSVFKMSMGDDQGGIDLAKKMGMSDEQIAKITTFAENVKGVFSNIKDTFNQLKDKFFEVVEQISPKFGTLTKTFSLVKDTLIAVFDSLWSFLSPIFTALGIAIGVIGDIAIVAFNNVIIPAVKWLGIAFSVMWKLVGPILKLLAELIKVAFTMIKVMWDNILKPFVEYMSKHFASMLEESGKWLKKLGDGFDGVGVWISKATDLAKDFANILSNIKIPDWVKNIGGKLKSAANWAGNIAFGSGPGVQDPGEGRYNGIKYVPRDGYQIRAHRGERVLTAKENKAYNKGGGNGRSFVINMNGTVIREEADVDRLAEKMVRKFIAAGEGGA
ncbi:hypothetical protein CSV75_04405 [Sporosarcina sp. P18a]|uniref:tape measure protein n=1 Tax=Sporosarcina sp. P18a TaxID=2048259 RepID=UPI000C170A38|nr:tape measure protein [Sporosarcina sp. P18a]PIC81027.1 hypothetical protein CSV75_04405 [Sporosarcina sp. P18a]